MIKLINLTLYDKNGNPCAYIDDEEHIFLFNGAAVAYFFEDSVYNYNGKQLGYFSAGWIFDNKGSRLFFTEYAKGGPVIPVKKIKPIKGTKSLVPVKNVKQISAVEPVNNLGWSDLSCSNFFK